MKLKEATLYPNRPISVNPVRQSFAVVNFLVALATIAATTKRLGVPDKTWAALSNWFDVIHSEFLERKLTITSQAMEIIELAKVVPFGDGVRAARLGFAGAAGVTISPGISPVPVGLQILLVFFRLLILPLRLLVFFRLLILPPRLPPRLLALFGQSIFPLRLLPRLLALFGLLIFPLAYLALRFQPISCTLIPIKPLSRFDLTALTTRLHHFATSSFFSYLNYTLVGGK